LEQKFVGDSLLTLDKVTLPVDGRVRQRGGKEESKSGNLHSE
jgi:hypothetical protein